MSLIGKTISWGLATVAVYASIFWNSKTIMKYIAKGHWYAILPVTAVFLVSAVHGSFTNYFWAMLGISAKKTITTRPAATQRQRARPEIRLSV